MHVTSRLLSVLAFGCNEPQEKIMDITFRFFTVIGLAFFAGCAGQNTSDKVSEKSPQEQTSSPTVHAPKLNIGDSWTFKTKNGTWVYTIREIKQNGNIVINTVPEENIGNKKASFTWFLTGDLNEIKIRLRNINIVNENHNGWLQFPLYLKKNWTHTYIQTGTKRKKRTAERFVAAYEQINVGSDAYWAYRIESNNQWYAANRPAKEVYWYAPSVGNIIKYRSRHLRRDFELIGTNVSIATNG